MYVLGAAYRCWLCCSISHMQHAHHLLLLLHMQCHPSMCCSHTHTHTLQIVPAPHMLAFTCSADTGDDDDRVLAQTPHPPTVEVYYQRCRCWCCWCGDCCWQKYLRHQQGTDVAQRSA